MVKRYECQPGYYNPLATILFNTQSTAIGAVLKATDNFYWSEIIIFLLLWYILTTISASTAVPSGIFLPIIIVGCALGEIYYMIYAKIFGENQETGAKYCIFGAAALLSGSTRMTYSVAVIVMETT